MDESYEELRDENVQSLGYLEVERLSDICGNEPDKTDG